MNKITKEVNQEIREERGREVESSQGINEREEELIEKAEELKSKVLKVLEEDYFQKNEKQFNKYMEKEYNAYDDEMMIGVIFGVVSDIVCYDYNSSPGYDSYGQVSYWSKTINKTVMLTQDDNFWYKNLDEIIEAIKGYEVEVQQVEYNMKHNKGGG